MLNGQSLSFVSDIQNLYIELFDSEGKITQNQVILCEYGQASGSITISDTSVTGPFVIRAYTDYQKNFGEEMFFHKTIRISESKNSFEIESGKPATSKEKPEIDVSFFPEGGFLIRKKVKCSMTESYDPHANAVAEQVNGILKQEFQLVPIRGL